MRSPTSRRLLLRVAAVLAVAVALVGWLGVRGLRAQRALEDARGSLQEARAALLDRDVGRAGTAIDRAAQQTGRARAMTSDPVWRAAAALPVLGPPLVQVRGLAAAVDEVAAGVLPPALSAVERLSGDGLRAPDGGVDLGRVAAAEPAVSAAVQRLQQVRQQLDGLPTSGPGPVRRARQQLDAQLDGLSRAAGAAQRALRLAPALLGQDRPRSYFVLVQQPGESRGTGGLVGGFAVLRADGGRIAVTAQGSNRELRNGTVARPPGVSADFAYEYAGNRALELWQDVNLSPDLPVVARLVAARWRAQSGQRVDGVLTLDPTALSLLLQGSGPVDVGGGRRVPPAQLVRYLTVEQYRGSGGAGTDQGRRKDGLSQAADAAARRLSTGSGDPSALVRGLVEAVRSGHLRMASDDPALAAGLREAGVDGALPRGPAPVAYAVVENATEGKLDAFLERSVSYTAGPCEGERRPGTIAVTLRNDAPATGLPPYLTVHVDEADTRTTQSTDSAVLLQVYGTRDAQLVSAELDGAPLSSGRGPGTSRLYEGLEAGMTFWQVYVPLPRGQDRRLVLHLDEPVVPGRARVPEQPLVRDQRSTVQVPECPSRG